MATISSDFVTEGITDSLLIIIQDVRALSMAAVMFAIGPALAAKDPNMVDPGRRIHARPRNILKRVLSQLEQV